MAVSLLSHEVSDLCIGKPPLKSLPGSATVGQAICVLKSSSSSAGTYIGISNNINNKKAATIVGKICMVDVLCYLCSTENISSPVAALEKPVSVLLPKDPSIGGIRSMGSNSSISEALDAILDGGGGGGNDNVIVPVPRRKEVAHCWLTQEDLLRFFLDSIFLFSSVAPLSVASLGLVRPAVLSVVSSSPAVSALALVRSALYEHTAVAVVTEDGRLVGEISPSTLSACDETVAAAIAALSAGELMAYIDCCSGAGVLSESVVEAVKTRLREKGMQGMIKLLEEEEETLSSSLSLSLSSASSSSSDDESEEGTVSKRRKPRRTKSSGSYSARMGRRAEEAIVCHPESSVVAVMVQALAHRVSYVWVVDDDEDEDDDRYGLVGVVTFQDLLRVFREHVPKA